MNTNNALFTAKSKGAFIKSFETGKMQKTIVEAFENTPSESEQRSWANSYAFLSLALMDETIPDDIEILCEYSFTAGTTAAKSKRADIVIRSREDNASKNISTIIVELKQWDKFYINNRKLRNPVEQVQKYCESAREELGDDKGLTACVFMHNLGREEDNICKPTSNIKVFYRGEFDDFRTFLKKELGNVLPSGHAIDRAKKSGYWRDNFPQKAGELRKALIEMGYAEPLNDDSYDYQPTEEGHLLGITKYCGYDVRKKKRFVVCGFSDDALRKLAEEIAD